MPDIVSTTTQKNEWELANALKEFLPEGLEWRDVGGYPILYQKGLLGFFKGDVAFLSSDKRITIERREWKAAILKAVSEYEAANGVTIDVCPNR